MTTNASIGYGTVLEIALASAPTSFTYIREMFNATPPSDTDETVDATHMQSPDRTRQFVAGLTDPGEASFEMNYVPGSATDLFLRSLKGLALVARLTFPNGVQVLFNCTRQSYEKNAPLDDKMTATLGLKVSGSPYLSAAAAPRNLVAPVITGTAQVGVVLTATGGEWAGASSVAYQWRKDDAGNGTFADISGATGNTYVPVGADEGDDILVEITAANAAFSTVLESDETAAVLAAA